MFKILRGFVMKVKDYFVGIYYSEIESIDNFYRQYR